MSGIEPLELSNSTAKLSISVAGLKTLSERMLDIQSDSQINPTWVCKDIRVVSYSGCCQTMASFAEGVKVAIPKIDIPIGTIAAMQDLQKKLRL